MPGQRRQKQLWWQLLHWAEKGLLKSKNRKSVSIEGLRFHSSHPLVVAVPEAHLRWWMEGLQPLLSWGVVGLVERGPWGATVGTCLEEKEAGGPGGLQREDRGS